jgi:NCAIR mutase (PurE)-related protein
VDPLRLRALLDDVAAGRVAPEAAASQLAIATGTGVTDAIVDLARAARTGVPEVVLGEWKTAEQIAAILRALAAGGRGALATRVNADKADAIVGVVAGARYDAVARTIVIEATEAPARCGAIAIVCAGTSDLPVAEEAAVTASFLGAEVRRVVDVGVAGLHRLLARIDIIRDADAAIVVAGMEGALPSVVAGLVDVPLIAVPTSVGYGVGAGGLVALAAMLSSCAPGVTVVNIDNGFGAAVAAVRSARRARSAT